MVVQDARRMRGAVFRARSRRKQGAWRSSSARTPIPAAARTSPACPRLGNPVPDAKSMAELLASAGFEVISCDGKTARLLRSQPRWAPQSAGPGSKRAPAGADLALVYFAGHGAATDEGNIVTPTDAKVNCETGAISQGVLVEQLLQGHRTRQAGIPDPRRLPR